jgi:hypothetical protein
MARTDPGAAGTPLRSSPADDTRAWMPASSRRCWRRTWAIGERHWLPVHNTSISMSAVYRHGTGALSSGPGGGEDLGGRDRALAQHPYAVGCA